MSVLNDKDREIMRRLRKNARVSLTDVAADIGMPTSTVYDRVRRAEKRIVHKHSTLLDFAKMGYNGRTTVAFKLSASSVQPALQALKACPNVNTLYRVDHGYDLLAEFVFQNLAELHNFLDEFSQKHQVVNQQLFTIIDDIKREEFVP
jgi:Lrp/AsnC family leucine-responsive transcriptional regulator